MRRGRAEKFIFVAGIPAYKTEIDVYNFFSHYGHIIEVQVLQAATMCKSFKLCVDNAAYESIIKQTVFLFEGRNVQCHPFITGFDLLKKNLRMNKCRVIVKKVPYFVSQDSLFEALESQAGQVSNIFEFKSDFRANTHSSMKNYKRYKTYSVLFEDSQSARLLENSYLYLEAFDTYVEVIKFRHRKSSPNKTPKNGTLYNPGADCWALPTAVTGLFDHEQTSPLQELPVSCSSGVSTWPALGHHASNLRFNRQQAR